MELKVSVVKDNRQCRTRPWLVRWYGEYDRCTGKQRRYSKSFLLRKDADLFKEEKEEEFQSSMPRDRQDITLKQLCQKFLANKCMTYTVGTRHGYEHTIKQLEKYFAPTTLVKNIRSEDIDNFLANLTPIPAWYLSEGRQLEDATKDKHLRQMKKIFNTAQEWGYIRTNPLKGKTIGKIRKKEWHYITVEQFNAILAHTNIVRDRALYGIMYWCGLRFGEAINLLWDQQNIDFGKRQINVYNRPPSKVIPPFNVKDYEARTVPMNDWVFDILKQLYSQKNEKNPFIFLSSDRYEIVKNRWHKLRSSGKSRDWENRFVLNNYLKRFKTRCKAGGIDTNLRLHIHCLRKSWATNLANSGRVPVHTLMSIGGWADIRTCEKYYLKISDANKERACEVLNELAGKGRGSQVDGLDDEGIERIGIYRFLRSSEHTQR